MIGEIPEWICEHINLLEFGIWINNMTGTIPDCMGNLLNLQYLELERNQISGPIPESLSRLSRLRTLNLANNRLQGSIPPELGNLEGLTLLDISVNELSGEIPESLGNLRLLQTLFLTWDFLPRHGSAITNRFTGTVPSSISQLTNLRQLTIGGPELSGKLPDLGGLRILNECAFQGSSLCYIPAYAPPFPSCKVDTLSVCPVISDCSILASWIPSLADLYQCCLFDEVGCEGDRIVSLELSKSGLSLNLIPSEVAGLDNLRKLDLSSTQLTGAFPNVLTRLVALETLYLGSNELTGPIPDDINSLINLRELHLQNTQLSGQLPITMASMESLELLNITGTPELEITFEPAFSTVTGQEILVGDNQGIVADGDDRIVIYLASTGAFLGLVSAALVAGFCLLRSRRKDGLYTEFDLKLIPKYTGRKREIRLLQPLQTGGFGAVWKGRYQKRIVAVKIPSDKQWSPKSNEVDAIRVSEMISKEASIMTQMKHPRVVEFIHLELESLSIVLEFMELGSLEAYIKENENTMSWPTRYQVMIDICEGMDFLHSNSFSDGTQKPVLFHQDLKSGNVLLCQEDFGIRAKIADFGMSGIFLLRSYLLPNFQP